MVILVFDGETKEAAGGPLPLLNLDRTPEVEDDDDMNSSSGTLPSSLNEDDNERRL